MWFLSSTVGILVCTVFIIEMDFTTGKSLTEFYVHQGSLHRQLQHLTEENSLGSSRSNGSSVVHSQDQATNLTFVRHKRSSRSKTIYRVRGSDLMNEVYCSYKVKLLTYKDLNGLRIYNVECDGCIGQLCQKKNRCVQTFEKVHIPTRHNSFEEVEIFTGCVCARPNIHRSRTIANMTQ